MVAITRFPSSTEPGRPAISVRRSLAQHPISIAQRNCSSQNRFSINRMTGSPSCQSLSTSRPKMATRNIAGISGCHLAPGRKCFSPSISRLQWREDSITQTLATRPIRRLAAQDHHRAANRSGQQVFQPAGPARIRYLCELVGRTPRLGRRSAISEQNEWPDLRSTGRDLVVVEAFGSVSRQRIPEEKNNGNS